MNANQSGAKRAAIYVRVSTAKQEGGASLKTQEASCRACAAELGYVVDEAYVYIETHTGVELWEHPRLSALRDAIRDGLIDAVIIHAIDRLSRDPMHLGIVLSEADRREVAVHFVTEPLDDSPEGQLIRFVRGYAAKVEHAKITERSIRNRRARVEGGRPLAGPRPPFGYRWVDAAKSRLEEDPSRSWVVRRIFAEAADGRGQQKIADGLNADRIPTPSGVPRWQQSTIRCILLNPAYAGRATGWRTQTVKDKARGIRVRRLRAAEEQIRLPDEVAPALIEPAVWEAVQQRFQLNMLRKVTSNLEPELTLLQGGYGRCGYCGASLMVHRRAKSPSYRCSRRQRFKDACRGVTIATGRLDAAAWARVERLLTDPTTIARELERLRAQDPTSSDLEAVDRSLARVDRQVVTLVDQLAELGPAVARVVREKLAAIEKQREQLVAEREVVLARRRSWEAAQTRLDELERWCRHVAMNLAGLAYDQRRLALDALGLKVRVWGSDHDTRFEIETGIPLEQVSNSSSGSTSRPSRAAPWLTPRRGPHPRGSGTVWSPRAARS